MTVIGGTQIEVANIQGTEVVKENEREGEGMRDITMSQGREQ